MRSNRFQCGKADLLHKDSIVPHSHTAPPPNAGRSQQHAVPPLQYRTTCPHRPDLRKKCGYRPRDSCAPNSNIAAGQPRWQPAAAATKPSNSDVGCTEKCRLWTARSRYPMGSQTLSRVVRDCQTLSLRGTQGEGLSDISHDHGSEASLVKSVTVAMRDLVRESVPLKNSCLLLSYFPALPSTRPVFS